MTNERGRPRNFDEDTALEKALQVFWQHGFQDASLSELTAAMGLNKPSLYATFGDKEALYLQVLKRYAEHKIAQHAALLDAEPHGRDAFERFLRAMAGMYTDPDLPGGCFIINGAADFGGSSTPASVESALRAALHTNESKLKERLLRAQLEGQLAPDASAEELAAAFMSLLAGLGVLAKSGAKRSKLYAIIKAAMAMWPEPKAKKKQ